MRSGHSLEFIITAGSGRGGGAGAAGRDDGRVREVAALLPVDAARGDDARDLPPLAVSAKRRAAARARAHTQYAGVTATPAAYSPPADTPSPGNLGTGETYEHLF